MDDIKNTLDELIIKKYCSLYGFSYRYFYDNAIIMTGVDEWRLRIIKNGKILVEHYNRAGNRTGKMQFHSQRYVSDLDYAFNNIIKPHENYETVFQEAFKIKDLLENYI